MNTVALAVLSPVETDLVNVGILFGVVALVSFFTLVWFYKIHHRKRRKRKHRHSHSHGHTTLSQRGGLPPMRETSDKPDLPPTS
jgi:hypothetical protein